MRKLFSLFCAGMLLSTLSLPSLGKDSDNPSQGTDRSERAYYRHKAVGERFQQMDQDHDGKISRSEWKGKPEVFDRLDADKDGFITREELSHARKHFHGRPGRALQEIDQDHDGKISRSEWKGKPEVFDRLDADKDGFITREELRNARRHHQVQ